MIELVIAERCLGCGDCIAACPTDVLERGPDGVPVIARQDDCQSCMLCELHCDADALYVGPHTHPVPVDRTAILASGKLGAFKRLSGWGEWTGDPRYPNDPWRMDENFRRARGAASRDAGGNPLREASPPPPDPPGSPSTIVTRGQP